MSYACRGILLAPRKTLGVTLHIYEVYGHMPDTEFKVASSKKLVFQTAQASQVTAGLEVRRPGAATELNIFPHGAVAGHGARGAPGCLVPSIFKGFTCWAFAQPLLMPTSA